MNRDEEDARRKALLANLHSQESSKNESRISSAIPEDDQIAFQDANLANLNSKDGSDMDIVDDLEEQEMVYYPKEDQTQYSKPLGLNKAPKKKDPEPFSFGENSLKPSYDHSKLLEDQTQNEVLSDFLDDLEGIDEGDESINLIPGGTQDPNDPHDPHGTLGPRGPHGTTGLLGDADDIHGRNGGAHGRTGDINGGIGGFGGILGDPGKKKKRPKKKKLTEEQKRRLRKVGDIYGQNAEDLGLSPRGGKKKGRITKKKSKSPNRGKKGGTKQEERATRFRGLNLNRPERSEAGEYDKLKRKLQKFRKRKDLSFWVDYDSPYAEFLPHRFREWVPETKTGLNLDENPKNMHANYKAMELSKIYSKGHGMVEETKEDEEFDPITGNYLSPNRAPSRNLRPKSNASMNVESVDELSSKKKSRGMTSSKRNKSLNKLPVVENSEEIIDF